MKFDKATTISPFEPEMIDLPYGDKSITHRVLICSALSDNKCRITNPAINADTLATIDCLRRLGATINFVEGNVIEVIPITTPNDNLILDCKNSGTTARLLAGVVVALGIRAIFVGDESLTARPMKRIMIPLKQMGADIREKNGCLFEIFPVDEIRGIEYKTTVPSAQVKSAILFAGLFAKGKTIVKEDIATRNHTEIFLAQFGADIKYGAGFAEVTASLPLKAKDIEIPNDFSTAAFLIAMNLQRGVSLKNVGINPTRTAFLEWLSEFGVSVKVSNKRELCGEMVGTITIPKTTNFKPVNTTSERSAEMIDEIPICCVLSVLAKGESTFYGLDELKVKESNRLLEIKKLLNSACIDIEEIPNGLLIKGQGKLDISYVPDTSDHRIIMLAVVAGILSDKFIPPKNPEAISVSCPNFFQLIGFPFEWGLIGTNVVKSLSPYIYDAICSVTGTKSNYTLFNIEEKDFITEFDKIISGVDGVNLTMPYKTTLSTNFNPINTIKKIGSVHLAFNTDGYGLIYALKKENIDVKNKNLLVLGCGGAGIEAVRILTKMGANVMVRNRTVSKVKELSIVYPIKEDYEGKFDGILSFLPPKADLQLVSKEELSQADFIFDASYLANTNFLSFARELNKKVIDGKLMLFGQGLKNFEIWTNKKLSDEEIDMAESLFLRSIANENINN